jgi:hypothetical protein
MRKKTLVVIFILLIALSASLYAGSTFGLGLVNYYAYADLEAQNFEAYVPGLRAEFFFADYIGVSGDFMYLGSLGPINFATLVANAVFRLPLGAIEPYIATGPAYLMAFDDEGNYEVADSALAYNVRGGVDFNIMDWLSIGAEVNFFVQDVVEFFDVLANSTSEEITEAIKTASKIGIIAKIKF